MEATRQYYFSCVKKLEKAKNLPLFLMRLILAYGFYGPAMMKWHHINDVAGMFTQLRIPLPLFSTYLVATTETFGAVLLLLGLGARLITIPLMIIMIVAITVVHWTNGFQAGNNGFEIPLYYLIMLFTLFIYGPGKISFDTLVKRGQYANELPSLD